MAVVIPFAAMLLDIMSWFITKQISSLAYVIIFGGALIGISMVMRILISIYQTWFYSNKNS